jgi:hypothetical protein
MSNMSVQCDTRLRAEGKHFGHLNCDLECVVRHSLETATAANIALTCSHFWDLPYKIMFPHFLTKYSWSIVFQYPATASAKCHTTKHSTDVLSVISK